MKKFLLICLLGVAQLGFAQEKEVATVELSSVRQLKIDGNLQIVLPGDLAKTDVEARAKYYTHYFTVNYNEASDVATIKMVDNTEKGRQIIVRFLTALGVEEVKVGEDQMDVNEFFTRYLK